MAKLIWHRSNGGSQVFDVPGGEVTIGRDAGNTVWLDSGSVSKRHAILRISGDGGSITDLGSSNGTRLNGQPIKTGALHDGDHLEIGTEKLVFRAAGGAPATVMTAPSAGPSRAVVIGGAAVIGIAVIATVVLVVAGPSGGRGGAPAAASDPSATTPSGATPSAATPAAAAPAAIDGVPAATAPQATPADPDAAPRGLPSNDPGVLYDRAMSEIRGGRFVEARRLLFAAAQRDPNNPTPHERLLQVEAAIQSLIDRHLAAGQRAFNYLRFDEAIAEWEQVAGMADASDPRRRQALTGIAQARARLAQK